MQSESLLKRSFSERGSNSDQMYSSPLIVTLLLSIYGFSETMCNTGSETLSFYSKELYGESDKFSANSFYFVDSGRIGSNELY